MSVRYELLATAPSGARAARLHTARGEVDLPAFLPVVAGSHVRPLLMPEVAASGARMCLANTNDLMRRPGPQALERVGGLHGYMAWEGVVLTDSGGAQLFTTPEASIAAQEATGADIMLALDDAHTTQHTNDWALRSLAARKRAALFAVVHGSVEQRSASAAFLSQHAFDGFAVGGLAAGEQREQLYQVIAQTAPLLPAGRPRHLMGVGTPEDLVEAVNAGFDMFDCVLPTMMAEQSYAYTFAGALRMVRGDYRSSDDPLDSTCHCPVCARFSRGYIHHLALGNHAAAVRLIAEHNLWHYQALVQRMRRAIIEDRWASEYRALREAFTPAREVRKVPGQNRGDLELVTVRSSGARAVRHKPSGEVMHPVGPWQEANVLYVEQTRLPALLAEERSEPVRILDVGLGAAANAVAALSCERKRPLEIVSLERDLDAIRLALGDPEGFPFLSAHRAACEAIAEGKSYETRDLRWRVLVGDAQSTLEDAGNAFDLVFFDPFSPKTNPELWSLAFATRVRARCRDGAQLATYSAAAPTRVMLLLAGFFVGHGVATGSRVETTIAATRLADLGSPLTARWLERWRRSPSRGTHERSLTPELEQQVLNHPQFVGPS